MAPLSEASKLAISRLRAYTPPGPTSWTTLPLSRRAAVLLLLFPDKKGDLRIVLTMRASTLSSFSGHAALPGGKADFESETPFEVARREASEEIGLPRTDSKLPPGFRVEELCEMPTNLAKTELVVRPCVAFMHHSSSSSAPGSTADPNINEPNGKGRDPSSVEEQLLPRLDAREVAAVFSAPFRNFLFDHDLPEEFPDASSGEVDKMPPQTNVPIEIWNGKKAEKKSEWYQGSWSDWHQQQWRMHNFFVPVTNQVVHKPKQKRQEGSDGQQTKQSDTVDQLDGLSRYRVWGMTARILVDAARYAYGQEPQFEHNSHYGDEEMIGRLRKIGRMGDIKKPGEQLTKKDMRKAASL